MRDKSHENAYIYTEAQHQQAIDEAVINALDEVEVPPVFTCNADFNSGYATAMNDFGININLIKAKHVSKQL